MQVTLFVTLQEMLNILGLSHGLILQNAFANASLCA